MSRSSRGYWDAIAAEYQGTTHIRVDDFHYGPLVPGDRALGLLPRSVEGMCCLELGCGGAQNSIHLARRGARCVACDLSGGQLAAARRLNAENGGLVALVQADLDRLPFAPAPRFDLIHSCYALPFVDSPERLVKAAADLLVAGGTMIFSTSHPLDTQQWMETDDGAFGVFVHDYFRPPPDRRQEGGNEEASKAVPVSTLFGWFRDAGLIVDRLLEPRPADGLSRRELRKQAPYWSEEWLELRHELSRIPFLTVVRALKP